MKKIIYTILGMGMMFAGTVYALPYFSSQQTLVPFVNSYYDLGTSTKAWRFLYVDQICLAGDCQTSWPTGSGGSGGGTWSTTTSPVTGVLFNYPNNNDDVITIGSNSSTTAEFYFDPNTLFARFLGRLSFAHASGTALTLTGSAYLPKLGNLTGNGFVKTSNSDGTLSVDTTTYETGLTAGDGLTRTVNDFDCDTASGSVFGCLSSADWTKFNNKQDTITAGDALTLTGTDIDFDGGATPGGSLGGTWASPTIDDLFILNTGDTGTGSYTFPYASTTAFSTSYASSTFYYGAGLPTTCDTTTGKLLWANGTFSCGTDAGAGASGEANTASSLGTGLNLYDSKSGVDLRFNTLLAGTNVTLSTTTNANTIVISATGGGGSAYEIATTSTIAIPQLAYFTKTGGLTTLGGVATTSLTATAPIALSQPISVLGSSASAITCATATGSIPGCISAANWNTFNNKVGTSTTPTLGHIAYWGGTATVPALSSVATSTPTVTAPITYSGTLGSFVGGSAGTFGCATANTTTAGCLTSTDWNTFNNKQASITDGDALTFTGATLNFDGGASPGGSLGGTWASPTIDDLFLLNDGDVGTGVFDFGGATSFEIPNGGPTVDTTGEVGIDTTSGQFKWSYNASTLGVTVPFYTMSFNVSSTTWGSGTTTVSLAPAMAAITVVSAKCETSAGTLNVSLYDGTNRANMINASTTIGTYTYSTNNTFTSSESIRVDIGTAASSPTWIGCRLKYTYDAD